MQTLTRFALALAAGILSLGAARAQAVSNLDLESWSNRTTSVSTGVDAPQNWLTDDDFSAAYEGQPLPASFNTLLKTTDSHSGSYAAKLVTDASGYASYFILGTHLGTNSANSYAGVPFTGRPAQFEFYYKLSSAAAAADSAYVLLELTRTVNGASQTVGYVSQTLNTPAATAITAAPDSVHLLFVSGVAQNITTGTALYIDDINLGTNLTATRNPELQAAISASPNPSPDGRYLLSSTEPALLAAPLTVLDLTGRVVRHEDAVARTATRSLDLSGLPAGIYTVQLFTDRGLVTRKLVR